MRWREAAVRLVVAGSGVQWKVAAVLVARQEVALPEGAAEGVGRTGVGAAVVRRVAAGTEAASAG